MSEMQELIVPETGELVDAPEPLLPSTTKLEAYTGASMLQVTPEQVNILTAPVPEDELDILPTGEIYMSQVRYRRILTKVFGPGGWSMVPLGKYFIQGHTICREYALMVQGHFIAQAIGEQEYQPGNARMSYATAAEGCKSNSLMRCCKELLIASECWDRRFTEKFKTEKCVQVWVKEKNKPQWRRQDQEPFYGEKGPVTKDSTPAAAPSSVTQPSSAEPLSEGSPSGANPLQAVVTITEIEYKTGEKDGKPWKKAMLKASNKIMYTTFSATYQAVAEEAKQQALPVAVVADKSTYGYLLKSMTIVEPSVQA